MTLTMGKVDKIRHELTMATTLIDKAMSEKMFEKYEDEYAKLRENDFKDETGKKFIMLPVPLLFLVGLITVVKTKYADKPGETREIFNDFLNKLPNEVDNLTALMFPVTLDSNHEYDKLVKDMNTAMSNDEKQKARDKSVLHGGQTVEEFLKTKNKNKKH